MPESANPSARPDSDGPSRSTLLYDPRFLRSAPAVLTFAELVFGLLVWMMVTGTEYFHVPAFGWVMFVAITYWVLTVIFFIVYLTKANARIPRIPWIPVALGFNSSGAVLYLVAVILDATSLHLANKEQHSFDGWVASTFFAFLVALCYAVHAYFSFRQWASSDGERQES